MSLDHRNILQWILESRDASENGYPHLAGYGSKWFGVTMRHSGVSLDTTSRYRELSIDVNADHEQYPSLISFVGETGAGKSTMINALIKVSEFLCFKKLCLYSFADQVLGQVKANSNTSYRASKTFKYSNKRGRAFVRRSFNWRFR